jgi:hypothetical protein
MDREDNKEIRKENGRLVCDTMREIGGPANFKTIKANLMEKVSVSSSKTFFVVGRFSKIFYFFYFRDLWSRSKFQV